MLNRAIGAALVVALLLGGGCSQSIESLNAKAKPAQDYESPRAVYDAMAAAGVGATTFVEDRAAIGPDGGTMYESGQVNLGNRFATIVVFPSSDFGKDSLDFYLTSWTSAAQGSGLKDPTVLQGTNWAIAGSGDLSKIQQALGGKLVR